MASAKYTSLLLAAMLGCAGCNVLLPSDWGQAGKPCRDDSDCAADFDCEQNRAGSNFCVPATKPQCSSDVECYNEFDLPSAYCGSSNVCEPWDKNHGFGDYCSYNGDCDEANGFFCACFLSDDNCYCSNVDCDTSDDCDSIGLGTLECMQTGFPTHPMVCGRPTYTGSIGVACPEGDKCEPGAACVWFEAVTKQFCTEQGCEGDGDCSWQFECYNGTCAFRDWLGFNKQPCTTDTAKTDCTDAYPDCPNDRCTKACQDDDDCPAATICQGGYCEYQS